MSVRSTKARLGWLCSLVFLAGGSSAQAPDRGNSGHGEGVYLPERVFSTLALDRPYRLTPYDGGFLLLDRGNHRVLRLDRAGVVEKQVSQVGQAPGELRFPRDFGVDGDGNLYVITGTVPFGIHAFGRDGAFLRAIHQGLGREDVEFYSSRSVAVGPAGTILLSQPRQGSLLIEYSSTGEKLRDLGTHLQPEDLYRQTCAAQPLCGDRRFAVSLNRVLAALESDGSVVVAFTIAPVVRKYSPEGRLLFETRLRGGVVDQLAEQQWDSPETWGSYYSFNSDGVQVLQMITGLSVDASTGLIYCMVGAREIFVLAPDGSQLTILRQHGERSRHLESITVVDGVAYMNDWRYLYRAKLPGLDLQQSDPRSGERGGK